jgi:ABC-type nitrate/sulfonate/bicarbonate transport system substrate-binding protein
MKKKIVAIGLITTLLLGLTACGEASGNATASSADSKTQAEETTTTISAEEVATSDGASVLAGELLDRYVTQEDVVTKEVIEQAIELLKEKYQFEALDELKIQSANWVYVAQGEGWFEDLLGENNTKVASIEGSIGNETQLMARDELHLANRMLYPYLLFKTQGADLTALTISADPDEDIVAILVNADSEYQTFDDLKGGTIGSWNAGCQYVALVELTEDRGWEFGKDWTYSNISNDSLKAALQAGEIDAISVHPLTNFNGSIIDGSFREIENAKEDGTYVNYGGASVSFTSTSFADSHENILKAVLKLRELTNAYIILNEEETAATVQKITRTPAENTIFWNERSAETFFNSQQSLEELISDTDAYQDWLISHVDEFTEENRVDSSSYFNAKFFK